MDDCHLSDGKRLKPSDTPGPVHFQDLAIDIFPFSDCAVCKGGILRFDISVQCLDVDFIREIPAEVPLFH